MTDPTAWAKGISADEPLDRVLSGMDYELLSDLPKVRVDVSAARHDVLEAVGRVPAGQPLPSAVARRVERGLGRARRAVAKLDVPQFERLSADRDAMVGVLRQRGILDDATAEIVREEAPGVGALAVAAGPGLRPTELARRDPAPRPLADPPSGAPDPGAVWGIVVLALAPLQILWAVTGILPYDVTTWLITIPVPIAAGILAGSGRRALRRADAGDGRLRFGGLVAVAGLAGFTILVTLACGFLDFPDALPIAGALAAGQLLAYVLWIGMADIERKKVPQRRPVPEARR
ncbi:hypothetical protein [Agromyces seonyuensis]|uniref:Uncharacterized protein n=1 Tax=Agromyces seonyuensis TaxID=2662446 RepID=A0A6I4NVB6_9MICO|nr:hypothetical protein [Agromyces seonyuensis]MWB98193.1 hypothetical protein [Agromyces seonyuensis]